MECLANLEKNQLVRVKTFFKYAQVFYERACIIFEDRSNSRINFDVECAMNVINLITLTPGLVETCLADSFAVSGDYTTENYMLRDDSQRIRTLSTHYQNPNLFIDE